MCHVCVSPPPQLWDYDQGLCVAIGLGHSGNIIKAVFSPDSGTVVSVGDEGSARASVSPGLPTPGSPLRRQPVVHFFSPKEEEDRPDGIYVWRVADEDR